MTGPTTAAELTVDTALLRKAAVIVEQASTAFAAGPSGGESSPMTDGSLGSSAVARQVVVTAGQRLARALEAARGLATLSDSVAAKLRTAADGFETVESTLIGRPR